MNSGSKIDVQFVNLPPEMKLDGIRSAQLWPFIYPALMIKNTSMFRNDNYLQMVHTIDMKDLPKDDPSN